MTRVTTTVFGALLLVGCMMISAPASGQESAGAAATVAAGDQGTIEPLLPGTQDVFIILRDMSLDYQAVSVRTVVANQDGASALVAFQDGTLADVEFVETTNGWSLRAVTFQSIARTSSPIW